MNPEAHLKTGPNSLLSLSSVSKEVRLENTKYGKAVTNGKPKKPGGSLFLDSKKPCHVKYFVDQYATSRMRIE